MSMVHAITDVRIFHDGTLTEPRLLHPESVAIAPDGAVWCGSDLGHLYRLSPDGSTLEERACTGGFILGLAFDHRGMLFACDLKHHCVFRFDPESGELVTFATGSADHSIAAPNWPVVDVRRNALYVSESANPGPGIWRFDLDSGEGQLWYASDLAFANGMALAADGDTLFVAETYGHRVTRIPITPDGTPDQPEIVAEFPGVLPDGVTLDTAGNLYVGCYEPSRIMRVGVDGTVDTLADDPMAGKLCHPTNCAFRGSELFIANLGRWHVSVLELGVEGLKLPVGG